MRSKLKIGMLIFLTGLLLSCINKNEPSSSILVHHSGALKTIMSGNIAATINLDSLSKRNHLYALGATENLKGEIQIFDSKPSNSFVRNSNLLIEDSFNLKAALFVYAEVEKWDEFIIEKVTNKDELEEIIFEIAKTNGQNIEKPFPFLLEGQVVTLDWHVINWKEGDTIHNHAKHKESGLSGTMRNTEVKILGFYSTKHKAVFTHHTTNMHLHFSTDDDLIAGHVDDLLVPEGITLKLPKQ